MTARFPQARPGRPVLPERPGIQGRAPGASCIARLLAALTRLLPKCSLRGASETGAALESQLSELREQQRAFDSAAAIAESDPGGTITHVNELFCVLSGYTRAELVGQNFRMLRSGRHDRAFFENLWQTIGGGRVWRGEICSRARDGRPFWTASTIIPIKDGGGVPQKYLSIRFDVTQRKLDEAALEAEKERWQVTLQSIDDAVVVTDARNRVAYINPSAESLLGVALEDAEGRSLSALMTLDRTGEEADNLAIKMARHQAIDAAEGEAVRIPHRIGDTGFSKGHVEIGAGLDGGTVDGRNCLHDPAIAPFDDGLPPQQKINVHGLLNFTSKQDIAVA